MKKIAMEASMFGIRQHHCKSSATLIWQKAFLKLTR